MSILFLKITFMIFWVSTGFIRAPFERQSKQVEVSIDRKNTEEKILLFGAVIGMMLLPLIYTFTPLLSFANYDPSLIINVIGFLLILPTLWLFYRSHKDLGRNWSPSLEVRTDHSLVDVGVYHLIRHPMYTAIWMWVILQACLLPNFIGGFSGIVAFGLLYFLGVGKEEKMMKDRFGAYYVQYKNRTKRLIPYVI
ncbi:MAG: protein-S-isoprenylcysteine O-methyltransferase [Bacteroidota bacterium]